MLFLCPKCDSSSIREINLIQSLPNFRERDKKYNKAKEVKIIDKKDLEEQLIKYRGTTDAQLTLAKNPMDRKDH